VFRTETSLAAEIFAPQIAAEEITHFSWRRTWLAGAYNRLALDEVGNGCFSVSGRFSESLLANQLAKTDAKPPSVHLQ